MKTNLLYIGNKLSQHGFNKTTVETLGPLLSQEGYEVIGASSKRNFILRCFDMLATIFKNRKKTDFILIDTYSTKAFWFAVFCSQLARILRIPYIPILHGGNLPKRLKSHQFVCQMVFANAYKNVAPSLYLKTEFEESGYQNVIHIPNAIELDYYSFKERTSFSPKILWVRAFDEIYNPKMAIAVLKCVQKTYAAATLTMVGPDKDGSLAITKEYAEAENVKVNFTGKLEKEAWWELASEQDIFINTTHFDNTPVSLLEAMALGLPIVSTNVGGIPYLVTDNKTALLVADNDVSAMSAAIIKICKEEAIGIKLVTNAEQLLNDYSWNSVKKQWQNLLK